MVICFLINENVWVFFSNFLKLTFRNKIVIGLEQQRREKWISENQLADDYSPPPGNL